MYRKRNGFVLYLWEEMNIFAAKYRERVKYLRNSIFKYLLIVLFMSYYIGGVAFTHVHHFTNYTIIHSHPYLPGPDGQPQHSHSQEALETIEQLTSLVLDLNPVPTLGVAWLLLSTFIYPSHIHFRLRTIRNYGLRAPPGYIPYSISFR